MHGHSSDITRFVVVVYFALTTLTTVGYGDYCPISSIERISVVLFMFIGIFIFSTMFGAMLNMLESYQS